MCIGDGGLNGVPFSSTLCLSSTCTPTSLFYRRFFLTWLEVIRGLVSQLMNERETITVVTVCYSGITFARGPTLKCGKDLKKQVLVPACTGCHVAP